MRKILNFIKIGLFDKKHGKSMPKKQAYVG
jgi:hypothetical protein